MEIKNDNKNMFDSLAIRRIRLARENELTSETVKVFSEPLKESIPYLGSFLYPLTVNNFSQFWSVQDKKDKEDEIRFWSIKLKLWDKKLAANERNDFSTRNDKFKQRYEEEEELLNKFEKVASFLNQLTPLQSENPIIYGEKAYCEPRIKVGNTLEIVEVQDWLEILDRAKLSRSLPLIYGSIPLSSTPYTLAGFNIKYGDKLLGLAWDQLSDLNIIPEAYRIYDVDREVLINIRKKIRPNETIKKERLFAFVNADKIYKCTYELVEGRIYFQYPEDGTDILELLASTFPNLDLGTPKEIGFRFTFKIFGLDLNNISFIHMIRTDSLLSRFIHLKENVKAFPEMEKPSFVFTGYGDKEEIKININPLVGSEKTAELIVMANKPGVVENFRQIFVRLMRYYLDNKEAEIKLLSHYLLDLPTDFKPQPPRFRKHTSEIDESIRQLPNHRKPVILDQGAAKDYGKILKFPSSGPTRFNFTCSDDIYAYPSFKRDLRINKLIPYCRRIEELSPEEIKYFEVEYPKIIEESKSRKKIISGDKELAINFLGNVDPNLIKLLKPIMDKVVPTGEILRMGNVPGFDSLIGCILLAVNDPAMKEPTSIATIRNIRREMALSINPIICKQENYLSSLEDIRLNLLDVDGELESKKYFRALEIFFQVNIFIWERIEEKINFEIPNSKFFSVRRFNVNWPSILIYRHNPRDPRKNEMDPQYQLLMSYEKSSNASIRIFGQEVTEYLITAYYTSYALYVWNNGKLKINPFISDYIKGGQPLGQILDTYGKCRGLVFNDYTLITPPVAPYDLNETSVQLATIETLSRFGPPTAISVIQNNLLVGLWFKDLYSPCQSVNIPVSFNNLPRIKPGWLNPNANTNNLGFNLTYRNLRILMTVIRWLNRIDPREFENYRSSGKIMVANVNYKIKNMGRRLPLVNNFDTALDYIKDKFINLVQGNNIVLPSLRILDHLDQVLQRADENWRKIPGNIPNFYLYSSDFQNTLLFNLDSLDLALFASETITTSPLIPEESGPNPTILKEENQMYLYYPLPGNNKLLTYTLFVKLRGLNVSFEEVKNSYILYQISEERKLVPIENHIEGRYFLTLIEDGVMVPLL